MLLHTVCLFTDRDALFSVRFSYLLTWLKWVIDKHFSHKINFWTFHFRFAQFCCSWTSNSKSSDAHCAQGLSRKQTKNFIIYLINKYQLIDKAIFHRIKFSPAIWIEMRWRMATALGLSSADKRKESFLMVRIIRYILTHFR